MTGPPTDDRALAERLRAVQAAARRDAEPIPTPVSIFDTPEIHEAFEQWREKLDRPNPLFHGWDEHQTHLDAYNELRREVEHEADRKMRDERDAGIAASREGARRVTVRRKHPAMDGIHAFLRGVDVTVDVHYLAPGVDLAELVS